MARWLAGRVVQALVVVLLVTTVSFVLVHLAPGDPFSIDDPRLTEAMRVRLRAQFGLDRPLLEQYLRWLAGAARGELGWSFSRHAPVARVMREALPYTLVLTGTGLVLAFAGGVAFGAWQAARRGTRLERLLDTLSLAIYAVPDFWLALMMLSAFTYWLPIFPAGGASDLLREAPLGSAGRALDLLRHLVLPATTLALLLAAAIARYQRSAMLEVLPADFVRTARAKGLPERRVLLRHALRNALLPVITLVGLSLPMLLGGALFVERVFGWPGMGDIALGAIASRDYPLVSATVVISGVLVALGSLVADLLSALADPRVRVR
ncbi:MAG TPA: ABC transporter permease [Gemmatimonadaceae bacterium]|nr:ABC transporter permease [Gemmatimonadaceae bacterium]